MKKTIFIFLLTITFLLTGCSNGVLTKISYDELSEKLNNKETFVVYFSSMDSNLENTLNDALSENNLEGFKVDTSKINNDEKLKLETSIAYTNPSIVFVINGKDSSILSHVINENTTKEEIVARLKDMKFIKEEK